MRQIQQHILEAVAGTPIFRCRCSHVRDKTALHVFHECQHRLHALSVRGQNLWARARDWFADLMKGSIPAMSALVEVAPCPEPMRSFIYVRTKLRVEDGKVQEGIEIQKEELKLGGFG